MNHATPQRATAPKLLRRCLVAVGALATIVACGHAPAHDGKHRPAANEFGSGPRASVSQLYVASLQAGEPLRKRRLQTVSVRVADAAGRPVENAMIAVGGGMPEHGHGLPTQPRVSRMLGNGVYEIDGLRFNMSGWWELELAIQAEAGTDTVTFNLDL